jgi:hypothetical protein
MCYEKEKDKVFYNRNDNIINDPKCITYKIKTSFDGEITINHSLVLATFWCIYLENKEKLLKDNFLKLELNSIYKGRTYMHFIKVTFKYSSIEELEDSLGECVWHYLSIARHSDPFLLSLMDIQLSSL